MSSGKVKCTCGWSWNKSDSSKKDMYICHECGRDNSNNMKNGGWLDSYADGGTMQEHQENYNDASVSLPEGFVGMSNDTSGRNYSPAWGGQFQTGGYVKKKIKKTERELLKEYVDPSTKKALEKAKQQGINTGTHNGPLDAIRHSSSAAAMTSALPTWTNFIPGVAPLKIAATNVAGIAHEINSPNSWKEHASDLYNNFIGSVVGALPIPEETQHDLLIKAQKYGVLSDMGDKTPLRKRPAAPQLAVPKLPPLQMGGSVYPVNYVPQAQGGMSMPGAVGFTYARTNDPAPSEGPYAKKTMASAKNGDVIVSDRGQWDYPGEVTEINSNEITMKPDPLTGKKLTRPLLGISDTGDVKIMKPGKDYKFKGTKVTEYPIAQEGENIPGGKNIKVKYPSGDIKTVNTGSPEYVDMYKTGKIQTPEGMANDTYWGGELDDVKVKGKLSPLAKARAEYDKKHGRDAFINQKKDEYIKGLGESNWFGTDRTNFPETVLRDINANYDYDRNTSALEKIAKQRGFDLNKRDNWIHNLTPGEREALINSKYSAQLNPNEFAESLSGLQQIGNTLLPGNPLNFSIAGLTPQEEEEDRNAKLSAFKVFSPLNLPGNAAANYLKNTNVSSYGDFRETPTLGMQRMGNVSPMESMAFNPLTYEALPALTKLAVKAPGAIADIPQNISKISETVSEVAPKVKQFGKDVRKNVGETYDRIKYLQDVKTNKTGELTDLTNNIDNVRTSYDSTPVEWMPRDIGELNSYIDNIKFNYRSALENIMEPNAATQQSLEIMNKAFRSPVGQRIEEVISGVGQPSTLEEVHGLIRDFANSLPEGTTFTKTIKNNITRAQKETIYNKRKDAAALKDFVKSIGKKKIPEQPLEYSQKEKETIAAIRELGKYKQVMQWQGSKVMSDPEALVNINKEILKLDDAVVQKLLGVTKQELLEKYKNVVPATKKTQSDITTNPLGVNDLTEVDDFGQPSLLESKLAPPQGRESLVKKIGRSYAESFGENPIDYQDPIRRPESLIGMAKTDYNYVQKPILNADGYPAGTGWHPEKLEAAGRTREQLMRALKKVEASPKDTNFIGSGSLSTDSYPLTLDAGTLMMKKGIVDVNVQKGVSSLNDMGYTNSMPKLVLKDINSKIEELEKLSGKKLPRAKYNPANKQYEVPQIYFTRLKQGGSINKADENSLVKLDQLTNFTNYNTKQPGGWLDNYN